MAARTVAELRSMPHRNEAIVITLCEFTSRSNVPAPCETYPQLWLIFLHDPGNRGAAGIFQASHHPENTYGLASQDGPLLLHQ